MRFRKPGLGMGLDSQPALSDREKVDRVESLVSGAPAALRPAFPSLGGIVAQTAAKSISGATFDLREFRALAERVRALSEHEDILPTSGPTKQILGIVSPVSANEASIRDRLVEILNPLSPQERDLVYQELDTMQQIVDLRERIAVASDDAQDARSQFDRILPEFQDKWREVVRRSKLVPLPPTSNTAANTEALLQAYAYMTEPVMRFSRLPDESHQESAREAAMTMVYHLAYKTPSVSRVIHKVAALDMTEEAIVMAQSFAVQWMHSGFARLEIGHKLAASLALTDAPDDIEVHAPWKAWSLILPPDLLGNDSSIARLWCEGSEVRFFVGMDGRLMGPVTREMIFHESGQEKGRLFAIACDSLVRGCCLALSNPDDYKKRSAGSCSKGKRSTREGEPDFGGARFMLSAPVSIDMRQHLTDYLVGKKHGGGSPTAQFLVRGHWRNQAHGPGRALRKQIRIEAFWKGPEESRVLLRNYKTKEDE